MPETPYSRVSTTGPSFEPVDICSVCIPYDILLSMKTSLVVVGSLICRVGEKSNGAHPHGQRG